MRKEMFDIVVYYDMNYLSRDHKTLEVTIEKGENLLARNLFALKGAIKNTFDNIHYVDIISASKFEVVFKQPIDAYCETAFVEAKPSNIDGFVAGFLADHG